MKSVILKIEGNKTYILNTMGEFQKIKTKPSYKVGMEVSSVPYVVERKKMIRRLQSVAAIASCLLIFAYGAVFAQEWDEPAYYLYVDINPSVRFEVNSFNRIINHSALNEEGLNVIKQIKPTGNIITTVENVVDISKSEGYMTSKGIDVTVVSDKDEDKLIAEREVAKTNISEKLSIKKITSETEQMAILQGVTPSRFALASEAAKLNPDLTFDTAIVQSEEYLHDLVSGEAQYLPIE